MAGLVRRCARCARRCDQRFPREQEAAFKRSLQPCFVLPGIIGASVLAATSQIYRELDWQGDSLKLFKLVLSGSGAALGLAWTLLLILRRWSPLCRRVDLEWGVLVTAAIYSVLYIGGGKWHVAQFFGREPLEEFGHAALYTEEMMVLWLDISTSFTCLVLPVRSHLSWIVPVFGVACFFAVNVVASSPFPQELPRTMAIVVGIAVVKWLGGFWQEQHTRDKWLAQCQVEKVKDFSEKQHQAFSHLLTRLCDCLVHLGPNLRLTEPSARLNAMLFLRDGSLEGSDFRDFLATKEDAERFEEALEAGSSTADPTGILSLHLRDSHGGQFQAHVYFSCFCDHDSSPYYVVGVVEAADREQPRELRNFGCPAIPAPSLGKHVAAAEQASEESSVSGSSLTLEPMTHDDLGEVSVTFVDNDEISIISATPGFTALCGPALAAPSLAHWLVDPLSFTRWTQDAVNSFRGHSHFEKLALRTQNSTAAGLEFVARDVFMDSITCVPGSEEDAFAVRITLDNIQQRALRRKRSAKSGAACEHRRRGQGSLGSCVRESESRNGRPGKEGDNVLDI